MSATPRIRCLVAVSALAITVLGLGSACGSDGDDLEEFRNGAMAQPAERR